MTISNKPKTPATTPAIMAGDVDESPSLDGEVDDDVVGEDPTEGGGGGDT